MGGGGKNVGCVNVFGDTPPRGSGGMLPQEILRVASTAEGAVSVEGNDCDNRVISRLG